MRGGAAQRATPATGNAATLRAAIAVAEDRRAADDRGLAPIREGLKGDPALQVAAVRALGRLERASLVPEIAPLLESPSAAVRVEAANALGQAVLRAEPGPASTLLTARARIETDPAVLGVIARTIGRLPYQQEVDVRAAERVLIEIADKASTWTSAKTPTPSSPSPSSQGPSGSTQSSAPSSSRSASKPSAVDSTSQILAGVSHGFDALARRAVKLGSLSADARGRLRTLARHGAGESGPAAAPASSAKGAAGATAGVSDATRVRRSSVSALVTARESNRPLLREVMRDPDDQVRRLGVVWMGITDDMPLRDDALRQAFGDASPMVRYEALRVHARSRTSAIENCALELSALQDPNPHVVLLAIDQLGRCSDAQQAADRLLAMVTPYFGEPSPSAAAAGASSSQAREWHSPAHAIVALAHLSPERAAPFVTRAATHGIWQMRMYAARAAGLLKDRATLDALAADRDDNVRNAALETLQPLVGHDADAQYLAALESGDYQLLRTAARALAGTTRKAEASPALMNAFVRITKDRRDTSRDARTALLDTLEETGKPAAEATATAATTGAPSGATTSAAAGAAATSGASPNAASSTSSASAASADALRPYLTDFDPVVAARVATLLTAWTGQAHQAAPAVAGGPAPIPVPSPGEIERLAKTRATVRMARGGTFTLALLPDVAPTNVARFVKLVRAGHFNGLTLHRVEPNFVVQGGSRGANEYAGDAAFTRDEVDLTSNARGTLGISTRGRDTGDGQLYVNLIDNVRLDHNYTVFAEILDGMPVVDTTLEGDIITRIDLNELP